MKLKLTKTHKIIIGVVGLGVLAFATKKYWMPKKKEDINTQSNPSAKELPVIDEYKDFEQNLRKIAPKLGLGLELKANADLRKTFKNLKITDDKDKNWIFKLVSIMAKDDYPWTYTGKNTAIDYYKKQGVDINEAKKSNEKIRDIIQTSNNNGEPTQSYKNKHQMKL